MLSRFNFKKTWIVVLLGALLWFCFHIPSIFYGTDNVPLYITYVGDEQVPVNGALHVLNEKNILALRDANKAYYGPIMVMMAVPPAVVDYARVRLFEDVSSALDYRNYLVWNWGGILILGRILSVIVGFAGLYFFTRILLLPEVNRTNRVWPVLLMVSLLATEYFYFHYTAQFRHWVFLNAILLAQIYLYFLMKRDSFKSLKLWIIQAILSVVTFGISYLGILFQVIWSLHFFSWCRKLHEHKQVLKQFFIYLTIIIVGSMLIIFWHPYAFFRIIGIVSADLQNDTDARVLEEDYGTHFSFGYYGELFFTNHVGLTLGAILIVLMLWYWRKHIIHSVYTPVLLLLVSYVLLFGFQSHHSTHYFLPAIILSHLLIGMFFVWLVNEFRGGSRVYLIPLTVFFFGTQLAFNGAVLYKLIEYLQVLPPDLALAKELVVLQEKYGGNVLLSGCGPVGVPHTWEAYADFASRAERYKTSLYSTILSEGFPFPSGVTLLDAYYDDNMPKGERLNSGDYDRVVVCHIFNPNGDPNQRLIHETNLLNYWNLEPFIDRYEFKN